MIYKEGNTQYKKRVGDWEKLGRLQAVGCRVRDERGKCLVSEVFGGKWNLKRAALWSFASYGTFGLHATDYWRSCRLDIQELFNWSQSLFSIRKRAITLDYSQLFPFILHFWVGSATGHSLFYVIKVWWQNIRIKKLHLSIDYYLILISQANIQDITRE